MCQPMATYLRMTALRPLWANVPAQHTQWTNTLEACTKLLRLRTFSCAFRVNSAIMPGVCVRQLVGGLAVDVTVGRRETVIGRRLMGGHVGGPARRRPTTESSVATRHQTWKPTWAMQRSPLRAVVGMKRRHLSSSVDTRLCTPVINTPRTSRPAFSSRFLGHRLAIHVPCFIGQLQCEIPRMYNERVAAVPTCRHQANENE